MNSAAQYSWKLAQAAAVWPEAHAENGQHPAPRVHLAKDPTASPPTVPTASPHVCAVHRFAVHPYPCRDQGKKKNTLSSFTKPTPPLLCLSTTRVPSSSRAIALLRSLTSPAVGSSAPVHLSSSPSRALNPCPATKNRSHHRHSMATEHLPSTALTSRAPALPTRQQLRLGTPLLIDPFSGCLDLATGPVPPFPAGRAVPPWNPLLQ
jgi:hypothetical protein